MNNFEHKPVMLAEVLNTFSYLRDRKNPVFVDGTVGLGGHAVALAKETIEVKAHLRGGSSGSRNYQIIAIDKDREALKIVEERTTENGLMDCFVFANDRFENIKQILSNLNIEKVDGVLLDLGVSSMQLDNGDRGFSFQVDAALDMRMNQEEGFTARDVVNKYSEKELVDIFSKYGEERFSKTIARKIAEERSRKPIETTKELSDTIVNAIPGRFRIDSRLDPRGPLWGGNDKKECGNDPASPRLRGAGQKSPATNVFRALRMEVNREVADLEQGICDAVSVLSVGGKLAIISFHSIEDRIVKQTFNKLANPCICPPRQPVCVCGLVPQVKVLTKKPIVASEEEINENSRARSAKLRIAERI